MQQDDCSLGIIINQIDNSTFIIAIAQGNSADKAGLKSMDEIYKLNGKIIVGVPLNEVFPKLRGKVGTTVSVTIKRINQPEKTKINIDNTVFKQTGVTPFWIEILSMVMPSYYKEDKVIKLLQTGVDVNTINESDRTLLDHVSYKIILKFAIFC